MKNNSYKNSSHTDGSENRFVKTDKNREAGSCRETVRNSTVFDRICVEDLDLKNEGDLDRFFDMLFGEWSQMSGAGIGVYPLIGMIAIDPENNMSSQVLVSRASFSAESDAKKDAKGEKHSEQSPGEKLESPVEGDSGGTVQKVSDDSSPAVGIRSDTGTDACTGCAVDRKIFLEMLADMNSLKGMIYAARQMILLTENGVIEQDQRNYTLSLYCENASAIVDKWADLRKDDH